MTNKVPYISEENGNLTPIEFFDLPFIPKRIFIIDSAPKGSVRGNHAHYKTKQFLICLKGKISVIINDAECTLSKNDSVLIPPLAWGVQKYLTGDDILLVMCSTEYSKDDYITNREFLNTNA